jgi:hypothetical protein
MITWLLAHRWPADFGTTRTELVGPDGGPVQVTGALDQLRDTVNRVRQPPTNGQDPQPTTPNGTNGNTP